MMMMNNAGSDPRSRGGEDEGAPGPRLGPGEPPGRGGGLQEDPRRREGAEGQRAKVVRRLSEGNTRVMKGAAVAVGNMQLL